MRPTHRLCMALILICGAALYTLTLEQSATHLSEDERIEAATQAAIDSRLRLRLQRIKQQEQQQSFFNTGAASGGKHDNRGGAAAAGRKRDPRLMELSSPEAQCSVPARDR